MNGGDVGVTGREVWCVCMHVPPLVHPEESQQLAAMDSDSSGNDFSMPDTARR